MGLIINGTTQFKTDGYDISQAELNRIYLDLQWITPTGTDSNVKVRFEKFTNTDMSEKVETVIDGIPRKGIEVDATSKIIEAGGLMGLNMEMLHDLVADKLIADYPDFAGKITRYDPFNIPS